MRSHPLRWLTALLLLAPVACGTEPTGPAGDGDPVELVPSNLALEVTLQGQDQNPSGDGSGVVFLELTGTNVDRVRFRFDDGRAFENDSGRLTYTFTEAGTNVHRIAAVAFSATGQADSVSTQVTVLVDSPTSGGLELVWADEFDVDGPVDPSKWHHQVIPIIGDSWANNEVQHYTDRTDNSYVSDGTLKIVAKREDYTFQGVTKSYTSARLNSTFVFQYGRVDIRARLPAEGGTWPALWTLGANIDEVGNAHGSTYGSVGWPASGEIDILEQTGWDKNRVIGHLHWGDTRTGAYQNQGGTRAIANASTAFHLFSLVWTEDEIRILLDDQVVHETPNTTGMPFDNLHYLLMNIAIGGTLGGAIPGDFAQAILEIDYVRIYQ